jgi:hypothetical protein
MDIKTTLDPVGEAQPVPGFDTLVAKMKEAWVVIKDKAGSVGTTVIVPYMTRCLDDLIVYLVEHEIPGSDKKATVLKAMSTIYDTVVHPALPFFARPFGRLIKNFIINVAVSNAIDWIVAKYNAGSWHPAATTNVLSLWGVPGGHRPGDQ